MPPSELNVRKDFPILQSSMHGKPLVYLDNGATTQKPLAVIEAISNFYRNDNSNIHRGLYDLSQRATDAYEAARDTVRQFLQAPEREECIFVRGTTEGVNLVAFSWSQQNLQAGDEVIVTGLEHHSNIVPWQMACERHGAHLKVWHAEEDGSLNRERLKSLLSDRTKMVAVQHVSNALGTIHDVAEIVSLAHSVGALVLVDGAQWVGHLPTDVTKLNCDFYVFSGHKLFGPTGIGVLWGRREHLDSMPPYQGGGDMIETVTYETSTYAELPNKFEAGTPDIAGAIGLAAAIDYINSVGFDAISRHEQNLLQYATEKLKSIPGLRIIGDHPHKAAVISFVLESPSIAPLDIATYLSNEGICVRTGHHCCMPLMGQMKVTGTTRASFAFYNTLSDVDQLFDRLTHLVSERSTDSSGEKSTTVGTEIEFGSQKGSSIREAAAELAEEFLEFDDRESKTELLMEIGQGVPQAFEALKAISTPVPGCMSEVYLIGRPNPAKPSAFEFAADSNAEIVRGLIGVLQHIYSGQAATEVLEFQIEAFFRQIGLDQFVSTQRRSGLDGMIKRIHTLASSIVERGADA